MPEVDECEREMRTESGIAKVNQSIEQPEALETAVNQNDEKENDRERTMSSSDSSSSFSSFSSSFGASAAGAPPAAGAAPPATGAPPPAPTFDRSSFTFLPSSAFASRVAQIGSRSTPAAFVNEMILSCCREGCERTR